jgi:integrase
MVLAYLAVVRGIPRGIGYATKLLQSGVDLKTVQKLLGPQKLESTMRYLAKAQSAEVRAKVDAACVIALHSPDGVAETGL